MDEFEKTKMKLAFPNLRAHPKSPVISGNIRFGKEKYGSEIRMIKINSP
jgi:hypothetical protein